MLDGVRSVLVTGATGQDGYFLLERLLGLGKQVLVPHRAVEPIAHLRGLPGAEERLRFREVSFENGLDWLDECFLQDQPDAIFNLAGQSSVGSSFAEPALTWKLNAEFVVALLEAMRKRAPGARLFPASSSEMFGGSATSSGVFDENAPIRPSSPYAASKAAAHLACQAYRSSFGLRAVCGILFNHESRFRGQGFLTAKVCNHVRQLSESDEKATLRVGNLSIRRDWGYAPEYVEGMLRIIDQVSVRDRGEPDEAGYYRDYVLGTGNANSVRTLIDTAFSLGGYELQWDLRNDRPETWSARFTDTKEAAVEVDPALFRPNEPTHIQADPTRARDELGWQPSTGLETFLREMLATR